jgi:hypothetical protein
LDIANEIETDLRNHNVDERILKAKALAFQGKYMDVFNLFC